MISDRICIDSDGIFVELRDRTRDVISIYKLDVIFEFSDAIFFGFEDDFVH